MARYYGHYSNVSRGKRKKAEKDKSIPSILEPDGSSKAFRKNWARLIQKIYEVDPLTCPKCSGTMRVISVIEDKDIIRKILEHLNLWDIKARPPPKNNKSQQETETVTDYSDTQLQPKDDYLFYDHDYPIDDYASLFFQIIGYNGFIRSNYANF